MYFSYGSEVFQRKIHLLNICMILLLFIGVDLSVNKLKPSLFSAATVQRYDANDLLMTLQEKETLKSFKKKVANRMPEAYMKTDFYLIRWLRLKENDMSAAERMLMLNIKWRQDNNISTILSEDFADMLESYHSTTDTHDKEDRPISTLNLGTWDIRTAVIQGKLPRLFRYTDSLFEKTVQNIFDAQKNGKEVTRALVLCDLEGFNMLQHTCSSCVSVFLKFLSRMQFHYPGFWEGVVFINSPPIFQLVMNSASGLITPEIRKIVKVFGNNKDQWMTYLDARVAKNQRYQNFGGHKFSSSF